MDLIGQLDSATLAFVTGLAGLLLAATMAGIRTAGMRNDALVFWGVAGLAAGVAHLLAHLTLGFHIQLPRRESLAVANALVTLVHVSLLAGVRVFLGKRSYWFPLALLAIATGSAGSARAAKAATTTIPIVFANGSDPVSVGLVASMNRPGGNITGVTFTTVDVTAKRLGQLHELVPAAELIGVIE